MTPRRIVTGLLLAFVAASVAFLVLKETRSGATAGSAAGAADPAADTVVAYYFYGAVRCTTCRKLEAYTREALETGFAREIGAGKLAWRPVNLEDGGNEHFVQDFQLTGKTVVVAELRGGTTVRWKKLDRTWDLVGDKTSFVDYVQAETREYLGAR